MNFLVLYKTGPGIGDLDVCGVVLEKKAEEAEEAIKEAMTRGPGEYIAVPFDPSKILCRKAKSVLSLGEPDPEPAPEQPSEAPPAQVADATRA
jgi:hypothetical protein